MKTAISIPDDLFSRADELAKRLGKTRSEFYADALRSHLVRNEDPAITARLDDVYAESELDASDREWIAGATFGMMARCR